MCNILFSLSFHKRFGHPHIRLLQQVETKAFRFYGILLVLFSGTTRTHTHLHLVFRGTGRMMCISSIRLLYFLSTYYFTISCGFLFLFALIARLSPPPPREATPSFHKLKTSMSYSPVVRPAVPRKSTIGRKASPGRNKRQDQYRTEQDSTRDQKQVTERNHYRMLYVYRNMNMYIHER
jgi:hypothetical protein